MRLTAICARVEWWAHQDSNLGQAGYEPAALTAELWAHIMVNGRWAIGNGSFQIHVPWPMAHFPSVRYGLPGTRAACGSATDAAACEAPSLRSDGCARG